ncbi:hypothetical protein J6590_022883 [Homalodisca vitripennis]|nr:hypothetical protein J6590_022883 [Homalodisca vitripennis]
MRCPMCNRTGMSRLVIAVSRLVTRSELTSNNLTIGDFDDRQAGAEVTLDGRAWEPTGAGLRLSLAHRHSVIGRPDSCRVQIGPLVGLLVAAGLVASPEYQLPLQTSTRTLVRSSSRFAAALLRTPGILMQKTSHTSHMYRIHHSPASYRSHSVTPLSCTCIIHGHLAYCHLLSLPA